MIILIKKITTESRKCSTSTDEWSKSSSYHIIIAHTHTTSQHHVRKKLLHRELNFFFFSKSAFKRLTAIAHVTHYYCTKQKIIIIKLDTWYNQQKKQTSQTADDDDNDNRMHLSSPYNIYCTHNETPDKTLIILYFFTVIPAFAANLFFFSFFKRPCAPQQSTSTIEKYNAPIFFYLKKKVCIPTRENWEKVHLVN